MLILFQRKQSAQVLQICSPPDSVACGGDIYDDLLSFLVDLGMLNRIISLAGLNSERVEEGCWLKEWPVVVCCLNHQGAQVVLVLFFA